MENIKIDWNGDWNEAPEWVMAVGRTKLGSQLVWFNEKQYQYVNLRVGQGPWDFSDPGSGGLAASLTRDKIGFEVLRPARTTWNGEGLPPVGTVCEVSCNQGAWAKAEIKFIGERFCVYQYVLQEGRSADQLTEISMHLTVMRFRPIRTPEQIAAEEREAKAKAMYLSIYYAESEEAWDRMPENSRLTFRNAIDAGWQQVKP